MLSLDAVQRKIAGCLTDGLVRDVARIRALNFPVWGAGRSAVDIRGQLTATDTPVQCGGVWVAPGDLVFADVDGVIVVPPEAEVEVVHRALEMATLERKFLRSLREGASMAESHARYGIF